MKAESYLFTGVAGFFLVVDAIYAWWSREPAGIAAPSWSCSTAAAWSLLAKRGVTRAHSTASSSLRAAASACFALRSRGVKLPPPALCVFCVLCAVWITWPLRRTFPE